MYAVYILRCSDNSYYTDLTNDFDKRMWQHETGFFPECYTFKKRPVKLMWHTRVESAEQANKLEKQIKGWSRKKKEAMIKGDIDELKNLSNYKKEQPTPKTLRQAQGQIEYLIVGQGISGTFLSYYLQKEKKEFLVIDNNYSSSPSRIAAGIINPVTGRRMVTVWMAEEIIPFAWDAYQEIGNDLNITAISHKNILDFFPNPFMRENFLQRIEEDNHHVHPYPEQNHFNEFFNYEFGCGEIRPVYIVNNELLLPGWRETLKKQQKLLEEDFDINALKINANNVEYKNIKANKIIFCDGVSGFTNPFFKQLPFAPNKGEALIVEIPGLPDHNIYKKSMILAPLQGMGANFFWIGSNYLWDFDNTDPTETFRKSTEQILKSWLKIPFKIIEHRSGIRPATLERRPFVGMHPHYPDIGILNGMGTKGYSLAPFFAKQLTDHLLYDHPITPEAGIARFQRILSQKDV